MSLFYLEIENDLVADQPFLFEADDFVSATMQALDFLRELDRRIGEYVGDTDLQPSKIKSLQETAMFMTSEDGIQKFLQTIEIHQEEDD